MAMQGKILLDVGGHRKDKMIRSELQLHLPKIWQSLRIFVSDVVPSSKILQITSAPREFFDLKNITTRHKTSPSSSG